MHAYNNHYLVPATYIQELLQCCEVHVHLATLLIYQASHRLIYIIMARTS